MVIHAVNRAGAFVTYHRLRKNWEVQRGWARIIKWFSQLFKLTLGGIIRQRITKLFSPSRDPNILPVKVRAFCASIFVVLQAIYFIAPFYIGFPRTLAADGLLLGVFGAGILYYETVAEVQELQIISDGIARIGSSTKLSLVEIIVVIAIAGLSFVMAFLQAAEFALKHNPNQVGLYTTLRGVVVVLVIYAIPASGTYGGTKWWRRFCSRWADRFQVSKTDETRRFLRLIGFTSLAFSALAQLPATFV